MKKLSILGALLAGVLFLTSCEDDRDSNPTMTDPSTFVLNTPKYANTTYDLDYSSTIQLDCSQPDYGFTAATVYSVQVSHDQSFEKYTELDSKYKTALMNVDANELAVAMTNMLVEEGKGESDFPVTTAMYVRLKATMSNGDGEILSNVVKLDAVKTSFALPAVTLPEKMYMIGDFGDWQTKNWDWDSATPMVQVNGQSGNFWRMIYFKAGAQLKFNYNTSWDGNDFGFAGTTFDDQAGAGLSDEGGNIKIDNAGWYIVVVRTTLKGRDFEYAVEFEKPNVYLFGDCAGGSWAASDAQLFTVPETANADFVSPAFTAVPGDGGVRACVVIDGSTDWWKTEFIPLDGKLEYRANGGDQDRITGAVGEKLYINFTAGTGEVK